MEPRKNKPLRALVVDDMASMRMVIKAVLNQMGCIDIVEASNGKDALQYLVANNNSVDILICDWNMPGMTGLEVLQKVRAKPELKRLPVLLVTAEQSKQQVKDAVIAGVTGYVTKPFTPAILQEHIQACLNKRVR
ncbi:response regulator [Chromatium okenii]|uniref:response regulator n=1 Tax=Chromatium okenii TaxID=61644 RepID=UPI0026F316F0|nr:response regulator [Chromatium okenii]MBV5309887.1 response regulator [Chromatium okenii]